MELECPSNHHGQQQAPSSWVPAVAQQRRQDDEPSHGQSSFQILPSSHNITETPANTAIPRPQLTKEEEDAMGDEIEVRREDQDKINKFSRLHQHELSIEEELTSKNVRRPSRHPPPPNYRSHPTHRKRRRS